MGADGFIVDPEQGVHFEMTCYACSRQIDMDDCPINQHHGCIDEDGRIPVMVDLGNYEQR